MDRDGGQSIARGAAGDADVAVATGVARESSPSTILVSAASGFLGSAIAAALRIRGHDIRVLARPSTPRTNLNPADTFNDGDLRAPASLATALHAAPYLFHSAANAILFSPIPQ